MREREREYNRNSLHSLIILNYLTYLLLTVATIALRQVLTHEVSHVLRHRTESMPQTRKANEHSHSHSLSLSLSHKLRAA